VITPNAAISYIVRTRTRYILYVQQPAPTQSVVSSGPFGRPTAHINPILSLVPPLHPSSLPHLGFFTITGSDKRRYIEKDFCRVRLWKEVSVC